MWRKNASLFLLIIMASILSASGCATIVRRSTQGVPVTSSPAGATVSVNGQKQGVTPLEIRLPRNKKDQVIRVESPGYDPLDIRLERRFSAGPAVGNILAGGITGYLITLLIWFAKDGSIVDEVALLATLCLGTALAYVLTDGITGAGYSLKPRDLIVTLKKIEGTSQVDMILIDADDFKNIKWIRVRRD